MRLLPKCSAYMYWIGCSISLKVKGLNRAKNKKKNPSVLYKTYRDLSEVGDTILIPNLSKGSDFSATDGYKAKSLLWGCLQQKFEATHKILLQLPHSHFGGPSAHQDKNIGIFCSNSLQFCEINCWELLSREKQGTGSSFSFHYVFSPLLSSKGPGNVITEDYLCCWGIPTCIICRFVPQTCTFAIV